MEHIILNYNQHKLLNYIIKHKKILKENIQFNLDIRKK